MQLLIIRLLATPYGILFTILFIAALSGESDENILTAGLIAAILYVVNSTINGSKSGKKKEQEQH